MKHLVLIIIVLALSLSCSKQAKNKPNIIKHLAMNNISEVITLEGVEVERQDSFDGKGSIMITTDKPRVIEISRIDSLSISNKKIIYKAGLKSRNLMGNAYLEMWVVVPGKGEFFSRGLNDLLTGSTNWHYKEIPFFVDKESTVTSIRLNLVINGKGTVWIDDITVSEEECKIN